jgi:hypothetical protein
LSTSSGLRRTSAKTKMYLTATLPMPAHDGAVSSSVIT